MISERDESADVASVKVGVGMGLEAGQSMVIVGEGEWRMVCRLLLIGLGLASRGSYSPMVVLEEVLFTCVVQEVDWQGCVSP